MYRRGVVSAVDAAKHRVRVTFPDRSNLESPWLDVLVRDTLSARGYHLPEVGAQVAVLCDEGENAGCVLGALYSDADPPPQAEPTTTLIEWADGSKLEYDRETHVMRVTLTGDGALELAGNASAVALATLVGNELEAIKGELANHMHQAGPSLLAPPGTAGGPVTGTTGVAVAITYNPGDVGAEKVKSA